MDPHLQAQAEEFADDLNRLVGKTFKGKQPLFRALTIEDGSRVSVTTQVINNGRAMFAPLTVTLHGRRNIPKVQFNISFECQWSTEQDFLGVQKSSMELKIEGLSNPLFRYDFDKLKTGENPSVYLHIHAHRDEIAWLMIQGNKSKPRGRKAKGSMPILSAIHFPLGGERFRPCLEDFFQFCIYEFGLQVKDSAKQALETGRREWKKKQLKAAISDSPMAAVEALRDYGWIVEEGVSARKSSREIATGKI